MFPGPGDQRDVAGRQYLTKAEINALSFATSELGRPRGCDDPFPVGRYWRAALVVSFNDDVDTGAVWRSTPAHEPILSAFLDLAAGLGHIRGRSRRMGGLPGLGAIGRLTPRPSTKRQRRSVKLQPSSATFVGKGGSCPVRR